MKSAEEKKADHALWRAKNREKTRAWSRAYAASPAARAKQKQRQTSSSYREYASQYAKRRRLARSAEERAAYNEAQNTARKAARRTAETWPKVILNDLKCRSRKMGLPFNLEICDIAVPALCPVFGLPFVFGCAQHPLSPSVDRLCPALGYVKGNVRVISRRANAIKQDSTSSSELRAVLNYMEREGL